MSEPSSLTPEQRFSDRVENYVKFRPGYPQAALEWIISKTGMRAGSHVADVGSGTGISTAFFLTSVATVSAVEPNSEMRQAAEQQLSANPNFRSISGSAEATTLQDGSVDIVAAAQAFHWFDSPKTRHEFQRILKPGGWVVLVWNVRELDTTPFLRDYENLLLKFGTDYETVRHENIGKEQLGNFFGNNIYESTSVPNFQQFDFEGLKGRLLSSSYAPGPGHPKHEEMLEELSAIFTRHEENGAVIFAYQTEIYAGKLG